VISLYLDDCIIDHRLARQLRAAGHLIYLPAELDVEGQSDELHLATAATLGAVTVTHNQRHFAPLHREWQATRRHHAGIILVVQGDYIGTKLACLDRAARLLTAEAARGQLMPFQMFGTEELGRAFVASLTSTGS
jgi:hypothetical protein